MNDTEDRHILYRRQEENERYRGQAYTEDRTGMNDTEDMHILYRIQDENERYRGQGGISNSV